jgi:hypothetical protein
MQEWDRQDPFRRSSADKQPPVVVQLRGMMAEQTQQLAHQRELIAKLTRRLVEAEARLTELERWKTMNGAITDYEA